MTHPRRESFGPDEIVIPARVRDGVNEDSVVALMSSISRIGLRTPITVRWERGDGDPTVILVAGRHRLEASRRLGVQLVDCFVFDGDEDDARLWEISENLHRADLTEAERRQHIAEWVKLTAEKVSHGGTPLLGGMQPQEQGIRKAAKELGLSKSSVERAVNAEKLAAPAKVVADEIGLGTVARAEISKAPAEEQIARVNDLKVARAARLLAEEEAKEARKANAATDTVIRLTVEQQFAEWIMRHASLSEVDTIIAWLQTSKSAGVISAMRREAA